MFSEKSSAKCWLTTIFVIILVLAALVLIIGDSFYWVGIYHRFATVTPGKVYCSGVMPPKKLVKCIKKHAINTVIDLREPKDMVGTADERQILEPIGVAYYHLPTPQIPTDETIA